MSNYKLPFVWFPEDGVWKQCANGPESEHPPQPTQEAVHEYFKTLPQQFQDEHHVRFDEYGNDGWNLNVPERTLNPWIEKRWEESGNDRVEYQCYGLVIRVLPERESVHVEFAYPAQHHHGLNALIRLKDVNEPEKLKMGTLVLLTTLKRDDGVRYHYLDVCPPTA